MNYKQHFQHIAFLTYEKSVLKKQFKVDILHECEIKIVGAK